MERLDAAYVDIRLSPVSQQRGWSGYELREMLGDRYVWLRSLGNTYYNRPDKPITIQNYDKGKEYLCNLLLDVSTFILMCGCRMLHTCHRKIVADRLVKEFGWSYAELNKLPS